VTSLNHTFSQADKQKYIFLQGGLGNQLFQISLHCLLLDLGYKSKVCPIFLQLPIKKVTKRKFETKPLLISSDISYLVPIFELLKIKASNKHGLYVERDLFKFTEKELQAALMNDLFIGFFQSYFIAEKSYQYLRNKLEKKIDYLEPIDSIGIHIRGQDYQNEKNKKYHGNSKAEYYKKSIDHLIKANEKIDDINVYTDDLKYAKELLQGIDFNLGTKFHHSSDPWSDLNRLKSHRYLVLTNSSFSWWAGFLAHKEHKANLMFPKMWTKSIETNNTELMHSDWGVVY
jgi:hypothetical protein